MFTRGVYRTLLDILYIRELIEKRITAGDMPQFGDRDVIRLNHMLDYANQSIPELNDVLTALEHYIRVKDKISGHDSE
jgi:hypothetical protein